MTFPTSTDTISYKCAGCGQWVAWNTYHTCPRYFPQTSFYYQVIDERIFNLLDRIAVALETLARAQPYMQATDAPHGADTPDEHSGVSA